MSTLCNNPRHTCPLCANTDDNRVKSLIQAGYTRESFNVWVKNLTHDRLNVVITCSHCNTHESLHNRSIEYVTQTLNVFKELHEGH